MQKSRYSGGKMEEDVGMLRKKLGDLGTVLDKHSKDNEQLTATIQ